MPVSDMQFHIPVLLQSACTFLDIHPHNRYIDTTLGGGGHTLEILHRGGRVLALDQDQSALDHFSSSILPALSLKEKSDLVLVKSNFSYLDEVAATNQWYPVAGILYDLGVSWHQLSTPERGFSFQTAGPLDMRMDQNLPHTAATLINLADYRQLNSILLDFADLNYPVLTKKIIAHRPYTTTVELSRVIGPAALSQKVFQALRIAVNDELGALSTSLSKAIDLLAPGGRIVVISFHSLEDRLTKTKFKDWSAAGLGEILTRKPEIPSDEEIAANPKSRSAKLRCFLKNNL